MNRRSIGSRAVIVGFSCSLLVLLIVGAVYGLYRLISGFARVEPTQLTLAVLMCGVLLSAHWISVGRKRAAWAEFQLAHREECRSLYLRILTFWTDTSSNSDSAFTLRVIADNNSDADLRCEIALRATARLLAQYETFRSHVTTTRSGAREAESQMLLILEMRRELGLGNDDSWSRRARNHSADADRKPPLGIHGLNG